MFQRLLANFDYPHLHQRPIKMIVKNQCPISSDRRRHIVLNYDLIPKESSYLNHAYLCWAMGAVSKKS